MADDPFTRLRSQREREHVALEKLLVAVGQAALAETFAGLWRHVLGERTVILAAGSPPNANGLESVAQRLWLTALNRWIKPVADSVWRTQHIDATSAVRDRLWEQVADRIKWTVDLVVTAIQVTLQRNTKLSPDHQRTLVAELLSLDSFTQSLWDEIHAVEADLLDPSRSKVDTDALYARRVRMQASVFLLDASRARSKGFAALAVAEPEQAAEYRRLAVQANRPVGRFTSAARDLQRLDEQIFYNPALEPERLATLRAKLDKVTGEGRQAEETWRKYLTRDARAVATGLLNASTLRYGIDQATATGVEWIKVWVSTDDDRVRPTHEKADRQLRSITKPFAVGAGLLDNPGDFGAPPEEFLGCRCGMYVMSRAQYDSMATELETLAAASTLEEKMTVTAEEELADLPPLMWHGVITHEETYTGDRRFWYAGAFRTQVMPFPIRFQREDWGGHSGAVVTANAEAARRFEGAIRAWGFFADGAATPEVEEVIGLIATRMMRGVSIDGDDTLDSQFNLEVDDSGNVYEKYTSTRLRGATLCAIPAFEGAQIYLGPPPADWLLEGEPLLVQQNEPGRTRALEDIPEHELEAMLAASRIPENLAEYWTGPEGSARVGGWGSPGSYTRCLSQLGSYVSPGQVAGACANLYHRATGRWPGTREAASKEAPYMLASTTMLSPDEHASSATGLQEHELITDADWEMSRDQFMPRELGALTPVTIDDEGNVFGHLAGWATCHAGFSDVCVTPPRSRTGYTLFHAGAVRLTDGSDLPVGKLTVGAGHANPTGLGVRGAAAHYDNSAVAVAVVRATEDKWGIQVAGRVIPGTPRERVEELRRSPISGDWRTYQGNLELIAGLGVNSPGFPVPRAMVASVEGCQVALVAAGYVAPYNGPLPSGWAAQMEPTQDELDRRVASLAARMASLNTEG